MNDLTNEQKYLLVSMYKEVLSRQPALSMEKANYFKDSDEVNDMFLPDLSSDYVSTLCWKLKSKGYISCTRGDDLANNIRLEDSTIIYMEHNFSNGLKSILSFLADIKSILFRPQIGFTNLFQSSLCTYLIFRS